MNLLQAAMAHGVIVWSTYRPDQRVTIIAFRKDDTTITVGISDVEILHMDHFDMSELIRKKMLESRIRLIPENSVSVQEDPK